MCPVPVRGLWHSWESCQPLWIQVTKGHDHRVTDCGRHMKGGLVAALSSVPQTLLSTLTFPDKQHQVAVEREALTTSSYAMFDI